jgi:hypothetical protein
VDLIAMIVSDAGLAHGEPHWGNASPFGCILIGLQPRGGWQVIQRAVQWGNDAWANCFGTKCDNNILFQYFACSVRNRLEVWNSENFLCPKVNHEDDSEPKTVEDAAGESLTLKPINTGDKKTERPRLEVVQTSDDPVATVTVASRKASAASTAVPAQASNKWNKFKVDGRDFSLRRPTKLIDGSRGGQAFLCELLRPEDGHEYGIDDQARMQFLSVILVAVSLIRNKNLGRWREVLKEDFQVGAGLGTVFRPLLVSLVVANIAVVLFIISVAYALFERNIYGRAAPFIIQLCSLCSWGVGATGLLMLGGNPRVRMKHRKIPEYVRKRLFHMHDATTPNKFCATDQSGNITLTFGSLHGSLFETGAGTCEIPAMMVEDICSLDLRLVRTRAWYCGMVWFILFMAASVVLQFAGSRVTTIGSQAMSVSIIIVTALARGAGVSGSEAWMIPKWKMRANATYGAALLGPMSSRM